MNHSSRRFEQAISDVLYENSPIVEAIGGVTRSPQQFFQFMVIGDPIPQGSAQAFYIKTLGRSVITHANKKTKPWRQQVAQTALCEMQVYGFDALMNGEPVEVDTEFYFEKPKSKPKSCIHKVTKPDGDKCVRAIWDALTGIAFKDDSQIVKWSGSKQYGSPARVIVRVAKAQF